MGTGALQRIMDGNLGLYMRFYFHSGLPFRSKVAIFNSIC